MENDNRIDMLDNIFEFSVIGLAENSDLSTFSNEYKDYTDFLLENAKELDSSGITKTYLILNSENKICAYFSILPGIAEIDGNLREQFPNINIPKYADKVGTLHIHHLAGDIDFCKKYKHLIKFIVNYLRAMIINVLSSYLKIMFISLDADINNDEDIDKKYEKSGFRQVKMNFELPFMLHPVYH